MIYICYKIKKEIKYEIKKCRKIYAKIINNNVPRGT